MYLMLMGRGGGGDARCEWTVKLRKKLDQIMCKMSDLTLCTFNMTFIQNIWIEVTLFKRVFVSLKQHNTLYHLLHCCQLSGGRGGGGTTILLMNEKRSTSGWRTSQSRTSFKLPIVTNFYEAWYVTTLLPMYNQWNMIQIKLIPWGNMNLTKPTYYLHCQRHIIRNSLLSGLQRNLVLLLVTESHCCYWCFFLSWHYPGIIDRRKFSSCRRLNCYD